MVSVILLMAGSGTRMNQDVNKILLPLGEKKLYQYPLDLFRSKGFEIVCVLKKEDEPQILPFLPERTKVCYGGKTRQESVYKGLKVCTGDYVFVHDAARALLSKDVVEEIVKNINLDDAIMVCKAVKDSIKKIENGKIINLNRKQLLAAETPQCASRKILLDVYEKAEKEGFEATDDMSLIEKYYPNIKIKLVEGNEYNFKITTPIDYKLAQIIVGGEND